MQVAYLEDTWSFLGWGKGRDTSSSTSFLLSTQEKGGGKFLFHIHILPSHSQGPQGSFLSSDLLVLQSPTSPLGLPGAAPVRTSNPAWHRIIRPASLGFPAAVLAPPSWPGPGEAGQLQKSSEAIWSFVRWLQEGIYQRSKSVLLSTQEKEKSALNGS